MARHMTSPVLLTHCPGGGGHLWTELNPRWYSDSRARPSSHKWCPEHHEERDAQKSRKLSKSAHERAKQYAKLPMPKSRRCTSPNPEHHGPGAVLPARDFYKRRREDANGVFRIVALDSRCKVCRRAERKAYVERVKDTVWFQESDRRRKKQDQAKRRKARRERAKEQDVRLHSQPFKDWLKEFLKSKGAMTVSELAAASGLDDGFFRKQQNGAKRVMLSCVDRVGQASGHPELVNELYPLTSE